MNRLWRILDRGFSSFWGRAHVTITRTASRPMTDADWAHFDAAFAKMDEAFDELRKIK